MLPSVGDDWLAARSWVRAQLGELLGVPGFDFTDLGGARAAIDARSVQVARGEAPQTGGNGLEVAMSQAIYRMDSTVRRAEALQAHPLTVGPRAAMHPRDMAAAGVADGGMARFATADGTATLPVRSSRTP